MQIALDYYQRQHGRDASREGEGWTAPAIGRGFSRLDAQRETTMVTPTGVARPKDQCETAGLTRQPRATAPNLHARQSLFGTR